MHDSCLYDMALRRLRDLIINDTVALVTRRMLVSRVVEDHTYRIQHRIEIALPVDNRIFVLANLNPFRPSRCLYNRQVHAVDTVRTKHTRQMILVLLRLADRMLQRHAAPYKR